MRSLRAVFVAWLIAFSVIPLVLGTLFFIQTFDQTYKQETNLRLESVTQELAATANLYESTSKEAFEYIQLSRYLQDFLEINLDSRISKLTDLMLEKKLDGIAVYSKSGLLLASHQKDESGKGVSFPTQKSNQGFYLPKEQLNRINSQDFYLGLKFNPKRKVTFLAFKNIILDKQRSLLVEIQFQLSLTDLQVLRSRRQADLMILDANFKTILSTWPEAPQSKKFFNLIWKEGGMASEMVNGAEVLIRPNSFKWGNNDLLLFAISPKQTWNEAITRIQFYVLVIFMILLTLIIVLSFLVTSNLINPLQNLVGVTRRALYEKLDVQLVASPFNEINSLSEAITTLSQDIHRTHQDLQNKITELQLAQSQLVQSEKLNSLGLLVAGIAHEINNPIGFIYSNLTPLKEYIAKILTSLSSLPPSEYQSLKPLIEDLPILIDSFSEGSLRIKKIVDGLRTFARSSTEQVEILNLSKLIESTLVLVSYEFKNRQIEVVWDLRPDVFIEGNATELSQVFINIFLNACQAMRTQGRLFIIIDSIQPTDQKLVQIRIKDTGPGILDSVKPYIFEPFYTTKSVGYGTGLGLSISYGIVKKHNGTITVESQIGDGATFVVTLPICV